MTDNDGAWQNKLLPYMIGAVIFFALFFLFASMYQLYSLQTEIEAEPKIHLDALYSHDADFDRQRWNSLVALEVHVLQQRYHQANISIMSRLWVRYLGFVTGMILAFMGAVFIVGKLKGGATIDVEGEGLKANLATQSPGIVLAFLGVVLMVVTIVIHHKVDVRDKPTYTAVTMTTTTDHGGAKPVPVDLNDEGAAQATIEGCLPWQVLMNKELGTHTDQEMNCLMRYESAQ
jgi:hypothetical protein